MAYYFAVETEKNSYLAKNIRDSKLFGSEGRTKKAYECTLNEIDLFTSSFKDEYELKKTLLKEGIITKKDINSNLAIFLLNEQEQRLVSNVILYQENKSLLYNPNKVVEYINKKAQNLDLDFFRQLAEIQEDNSKTKTLITTILSMLEKNLNNNSYNDKVGDSKITEAIIKLLIFKVKKNKNGIDLCSQEVNDEKLHNLIVFINNYESSLIKNNENKLKKVRTI